MTRIKALTGLIAATATLAAMPAIARAEVLFDQTADAATPNAEPGDPNFSPSNDFGGGNEDRTADDFTVPAGETWVIDRISVTGAYEAEPMPRSAGSASPRRAPAPQVSVFIYPDAGGQPAPALHAEAGVGASGGPNYAVALTGAPELAPGTYWVTVQQDGAGPAGFWSWGTSTTLSGNPAQWFSAADAECAGSSTWLPRLDCWPGTNPDQAFRLEGTRTVEDSDPPETTITKQPKDKTSKDRVTYRFTSDEEGSTFECKIDKKPYKPCTSPKKFKAKDGKHKFKVRATDAAGNVDPTPDRDKFKAV
jgi:hypothetical protein